MKFHERARLVGNGVNEFDAFVQLRDISETACKDRLRSFWGDRAGGDWEQVKKFADHSFTLLAAMGEGEIGFREALKAEKELQRRLGPNGAPEPA
jgi:hypothetical protein